jgi:hypothetical protein
MEVRASLQIRGIRDRRALEFLFFCLDGLGCETVTYYGKSGAIQSLGLMMSFDRGHGIVS